MDRSIDKKYNIFKRNDDYENQVIYLFFLNKSEKKIIIKWTKLIYTYTNEQMTCSSVFRIVNGGG